MNKIQREKDFKGRTLKNMCKFRTGRKKLTRVLKRFLEKKNQI